MKKTIAIIAVICVIIVIFSIPTFAWESGEKAPLWANGLDHVYDSGQSAGAFGAIYGTIDDTRVNGIYNFAQTTLNDVYYEMSLTEDFEFIGPRSENTVLYFLYSTDRNVYADYEITSGNDVINNVQISYVTVSDVEFQAYSKSLGQNLTYTFRIAQSFTAVKVVIDYSNSGDSRVRINLHFTDTDIGQYITDYSDIWSAMRGAINSGNIEVVGRYLRSILNVAWINQLFILGIVAVVISLAYNWLRSL